MLWEFIPYMTLFFQYWKCLIKAFQKQRSWPNKPWVLLVSLNHFPVAVHWIGSTQWIHLLQHTANVGQLRGFISFYWISSINLYTNSLLKKFHRCCSALMCRCFWHEKIHFTFLKTNQTIRLPGLENQM